MKHTQLFTQLLAILLLLSFPQSHAETSDALTPLYREITEKVFPGLSEFIEPLIRSESEDFSDNGFINTAQCAYFAWAIQANQKISQLRNTQISWQLPPDEQQAILSEYCPSYPQVMKLKLPDTHYPLKSPYFPVSEFLSAVEKSYSPIASYIQMMPSYQAKTLSDNAEPSDAKKRIIIETLLFLLSKIVSHEPKSLWSEQYTRLFRDVMSSFHCSRFIKTDTPDLTLFSDCLSKQTDDETQRSNQATVLTDIALGEFLQEGQLHNSFNAYGYQPGFAFASGNMGQSQPRYYGTGYSVIAETMVLLFLLLRH